MGTNVAQAKAHTAACFAKGTVPAPYYLYLLMRAQRASTAVQSGCAGNAGGTVYVQRHTAQHKQCAKAKANHARTPTATRAQWVTMQVPVQRMVRGVPVMQLVTVTNRKQVAIVA